MPIYPLSAGYRRAAAVPAVAVAALTLAFHAIPAAAQFAQPDPIDFNDNNHAGWTSLFDGRTLKGWDGDIHYWHVENGAITAESTCERPTGTIYLIWQGGQPADFELKLEMRGEGAGINSGIQYRGSILPPRPAAPGPARAATGTCPSGQPRGAPPPAASQAKWDMQGAQFDFDGRNAYTGSITNRPPDAASWPGAARWCAPNRASAPACWPRWATAMNWAATSKSKGGINCT